MRSPVRPAPPGCCFRAVDGRFAGGGDLAEISWVTRWKQEQHPAGQLPGGHPAIGQGAHGLVVQQAVGQAAGAGRLHKASSMYSCTRAMPCISRQGIISGSMARGSSQPHLRGLAPAAGCMRCKKPDTQRAHPAGRPSAGRCRCPAPAGRWRRRDSSEPSSFISSSALSR